MSPMSFETFDKFIYLNEINKNLTNIALFVVLEVIRTRSEDKMINDLYSCIYCNFLLPIVSRVGYKGDRTVRPPRVHRGYERSPWSPPRGPGDLHRAQRSP